MSANQIYRYQSVYWFSPVTIFWYVEPEVKIRFATVDDAAFEKLLYEKDAKNTRSRRYGHST
jgi:hypothetical protein